MNHHPSIPRIFVTSATLVILAAISGCASSSKLPPYTEAEDKSPSARLRIVAFPGTGVFAAVYPEVSGPCIAKSGAMRLAVHTNTSGFSGPSKKRIGMPFAAGGYENWGSEFRLPAGKPITIGLSYSGRNGRYSVQCDSAFRFTPIAGRDYQAIPTAGFLSTHRSSGRCHLDFSEIKEGHLDTKNAVVSYPVKLTPVWIEGTEGWLQRCSTPSN